MTMDSTVHYTVLIVINNHTVGILVIIIVYVSILQIPNIATL